MTASTGNADALLDRAALTEELIVAEGQRLSALAAGLGVLADETRLRILEYIAAGEQCVCHITEALNLSQPLASYHLAVLRDAGLVSDRRDARWVYYSLQEERLRQIGEHLHQLLELDGASAEARCASDDAC